MILAGESARTPVKSNVIRDWDKSWSPSRVDSSLTIEKTLGMN
jgi:hypothetical protein